MIENKSSITLFCMTEKGFAVLRHLAATHAGCIDQVIGSRDLNVKNDFYVEIQELCSDFGINFVDKSENVKVTSKYSFAIGWRWLINNENSSLVVFHDSLLPKYRGFAPVVSALLNGDSSIGVTALHASEEYDRGDIIGQDSLCISYPIKIQAVITALSDLYASLALTLVEKIINDRDIPSIKQDESLATYSLWRDEDDYAVNWDQDSDYICRFIDAVSYPYSGASTILNGQLYRILDAELVDDVVVENRVPGKVIFKRGCRPVVVCGKGLVQINELISEETGTDALSNLAFRSRFR
ncbi:methionyl-tRNA formyltransferase [Enterovibrio sp. ZSDZ42]|uniref:Methionyl-tRNA formyltransferase n=1 Tax=Enterovibrio gelatinilyticus TaxID=2899819 RepID=A0ABT5QXP0_9GAMM|nr:formyltransferase family protein [Enterovibrio sp. ZSDZ42]MDD1792370.1 methionyl-tRNA formyltransferase [Enterovibrio sp. ZSDZ42]